MPSSTTIAPSGCAAASAAPSEAGVSGPGRGRRDGAGVRRTAPSAAPSGRRGARAPRSRPRPARSAPRPAAPAAGSRSAGPDRRRTRPARRPGERRARMRPRSAAVAPPGSTRGRGITGRPAPRSIRAGERLRQQAAAGRRGDPPGRASRLARIRARRPPSSRTASAGAERRRRARRRRRRRARARRGRGTVARSRRRRPTRTSAGTMSVATPPGGPVAAATASARSAATLRAPTRTSAPSTTPARRTPRRRLQRRALADVRRRVVPDHDDDRRAPLGRVVEVGQAVRQPRPEVQQHERRPPAHPRERVRRARATPSKSPSIGRTPEPSSPRTRSISVVPGLAKQTSRPAAAAVRSRLVRPGQSCSSS